MVIHADSSYVIDLLREQTRGRSGRATVFLEAHAADRLLASVFVVCELEAGAANASLPDRERTRARAILEAVDIQYPDERFAPVYGELLCKLQRAGRTVATMDLLIATAAVLDDAALVTANRRHFDAIPGLQVLDYR
jgi:predicted nucleic acid-binding protein